MKFEQYVILPDRMNEIVNSVRSLLFVGDELKYDAAISVNIKTVTGQINAYLTGGRVVPFDDMSQVAMPDPLIDSVVIPMTAGLTRQYIPVTPRKRSMSEGGSSVTYDTTAPAYSTDIEDYLKFIRPYRRLGTVRRV